MDRFKFLSCVDFSEVADHAVAEGIKLAEHANAELHLFHVNTGKAADAASIEEKFKTLISKYTTDIPVTYNIVSPIGSISETIGNYAEGMNADLLIAGYEVKSGLKRLFEISLSKIIDETKVGVLAFRKDLSLSGTKTILFPIIEDSESRQKTNNVARLASKIGFNVHILTIWIPGTNTEAAKGKLKVYAKQVAERMEQNGVEYTIAHLDGRNPIDIVNAYATLNKTSIISKVFDGTQTPLSKLVGTEEEDVQAQSIRPIFYTRTMNEKVDKYKQTQKGS